MLDGCWEVEEERLKRQDAEDSRTKLTSEMEALRVEAGKWKKWNRKEFMLTEQKCKSADCGCGMLSTTNHSNK